jgi:hypothetical protein
MNDYKELDAMILKRIELLCAAKPKVKVNFAVVCSQNIEQVAQQFTGGGRGSFPQPPWRVVDRRLQALRKRGAISYSKDAGWTLMKGGAA